MSDIGALMRRRQDWAHAKGEKVLAEEYRQAAERIDALEAENAKMQVFFAAEEYWFERHQQVEAERDRLAADNARLNSEIENCWTTAEADLKYHRALEGQNAALRLRLKDFGDSGVGQAGGSGDGAK